MEKIDTSMRKEKKVALNNRRQKQKLRRAIPPQTKKLRKVSGKIYEIT